MRQLSSEWYSVPGGPCPEGHSQGQGCGVGSCAPSLSQCGRGASSGGGSRGGSEAFSGRRRAVRGQGAGIGHQLARPSRLSNLRGASGSPGPVGPIEWAGGWQVLPVACDWEQKRLGRECVPSDRPGFKRRLAVP